MQTGFNFQMDVRIKKIINNFVETVEKILIKMINVLNVILICNLKHINVTTPRGLDINFDCD